MKKKNLAGALLCSLCLTAGSIMPAMPVMADSMKVVTLGADLTDEQKTTMLNYFQVSSSEVQILTITNEDEREHLSAYVPIEQIGTRTVSCAYVKPTDSGGIKVRTANLNWVTCNMIATTLSTSGVKNCEVVAACPFEVSGTGALTGIQMAYETATGETLDETKKELATEEMVVTGNLADEVGQDSATTVINQSKMEVIQNDVQNADEIYNVVVNVAQENNISMDSEQLDTIVSLLEQIAQQGYNYDDMKETLERVNENVTGESTGESSDDTSADSIVNNVDDSVLGEGVISNSTEDPNLEQTGSEPAASRESTEDTQTGESSEEYTEDTGIPEATDDGTQQTEETEPDVSLLSEQAQYQYNKAKFFCEGEYEGDSESMTEAVGEENTYVSVYLEEETAAKLSKKVEQMYYTILLEGTDSYVPTGTEMYLSVELNMLNAQMKELFGIDENTLGEEDILADISQEDRDTLYGETLKFFEKLYGEYTETYSEESYEEESYAEESGAQEESSDEGYYEEEENYYEEDGE
jgi:uncharacterized protein YpuA (DUF1002 family)